MSKQFTKCPSNYVSAATNVALPVPFDRYYEVISAPKLAKMLGIAVKELPRCGRIEKECKHLAWLVVREQYENTRLADSELNFVELIHETDYDVVSVSYPLGGRVYRVDQSKVIELAQAPIESTTHLVSSVDPFYTTIEQARFAMEEVCKGLVDLEEFSNQITDDQMDILSEAYQILDSLAR